jgi:phenylpropionate dioxygenase-like ring-hydroxylating dioxygenase large terminal subunit
MSTPGYSAAELRALVHEEKIHRRAYLDPQLFELEMERIFKRAWIYVGHESQVAKPGDFFTTRIARMPVVMSRHTDGKVYVLYNRCGHRGALVVQEAQGNCKRFQCMYHGWTYETNGDLKAITFPEGFGPEVLDKCDPQYGMVRLAGVDTYRGFVFAKQVRSGPSLLEWLGDARAAIDEVVDRSPLGEVEISAGCHRYIYRGNWKLQADNLGDQTHAPFSHVSSLGSDGYQFRRRSGTSGTRIKIVDERGNIAMRSQGLWSYPGGHASTGSHGMDGEQRGGAFEEYHRVMVAAYGAERAAEILRHKRHTAYFYPSVDFHVLANAVRVIHPLTVDKTEVTIWPIKLKGAPDEIFHEALRFVNLSHAAASLGQTDDVEAFERSQRAFETSGAEWVNFVGGIGQDAPSAERGGIHGPPCSELGVRGMHRAWLDYMTNAEEQG